MTAEQSHRLVELLGPEAVSTDPAICAEYAGDRWFASHLPEAVVSPTTTEQVSGLMQWATKHRVPVTPRGAGVGYVGGCVPVQAGVLLNLQRMNRLLEIHPADAVAVVQPGVITGDLQSEARALGLYYPPDPASLKECSLGGNIATNAGGPRCLKYGVTRHYVLGLTVVLASGQVLQTGGRTHKNKTGFDLTALFVGSEGLLGIVTEATLRLLPLPPARATLSAGFETFRQAAGAVQRIFAHGFLPAALEITDQFTLEAARRHLGSDFVPSGSAHLLLDLDGQAPSVEAESGLLENLLCDLGARDLRKAVGEEECERLWDLRRGFSASLKATGLVKLNEDVTVPRGRITDLADFAAGLHEKYGYPVACFGHAGDGNLHVNIMAADYHGDPAVQARVGEALDELFRQVIAWGGAITGEHGIGLAKARWWPEAVSEVSRNTHDALKTALDPLGLLNPGKFARSTPPL